MFISCWRRKTNWTKLHLQRRKKESSENLKHDLRFSFKTDLKLRFLTNWKFQNSSVLHVQQELHFWWDMKLCRIWTQILFVGKERRFGFSELWIQIMCRKSCRFCFLELLASSVTKSLWWGIPKTVFFGKQLQKVGRHCCSAKLSFLHMHSGPPWRIAPQRVAWHTNAEKRCQGQLKQGSHISQLSSNCQHGRPAK